MNLFTKFLKHIFGQKTPQNVQSLQSPAKAPEFSHPWRLGMKVLFEYGYAAQIGKIVAVEKDRIGVSLSVGTIIITQGDYKWRTLMEVK